MESHFKERLHHYGLLAFIIVLAAIVRTWNLAEVPPGLFPDEAFNATDAFDAVFNQGFRWFYPGNNGREGAYINVMALGFGLFDVSTFTVRLPSVLFGVLTVISVYGLVRELFRSHPQIALVAAYLVSVSFWAIEFSRIGFRGGMMLPFLCLTLMLLFRGKRTGKMSNFVLAGIACGIGFNTYLAFRIMPVLLLVLLLLFSVVEKEFLRRFWKAILLFVFSMSIFVAPMAYELYLEPDNIEARTGELTIFNEANRIYKLPFESEATVHSLPTTLAGTITLSLSKYNLLGDPFWLHGFASYPVLEPLTGLIFLTGAFFLLRRFLSSIRNRPSTVANNDDVVVTGLLLCWFSVFLVPEFLSAVGLPNTLRGIGTLPVVYIFIAYAIHLFLKAEIAVAGKSGLFTSFRRSLAPARTRKVLVILFLVYLGCFNIAKYHVYWASRPEVAVAYKKELWDIAQAIKTDESEKIYTLLKMWEFHTVRIYNMDNPRLINLEDENPDGIVPDAHTVIYFPSQSSAILETVINHFGRERIRISTVEDNNGIGFYKIAFQPNK